MMILFGGNSFIGRHVAAAAEGRYPVTVVSRKKDEAFLAQNAPSAGFMHPEEFFGAAGAELVRSAGAFLYLANTSIPASNAATPWTELSDNVIPAFSAVMRTAELNPNIRILFPSSGGTVYGDGPTTPIAETAPLNPISPYGLAKVMAEQTIGYIARKTGADFAILRIANPVGFWHSTRGQGLVEVALKKAWSGEPLTVFGDGGQVRDYFDADDLAEALLLTGFAEGRLGDVWNLGSGVGYTVREIVDIVTAATGKPLELSFSPKRHTDVGYSILDVEKVKARFGWQAATTLTQTVEKIIRISATSEQL
jgi:UDP-glucose 4-epimerase